MQTAFLTLLFGMMVIVSAQADHQAARRQFYELEQQSWREYIRRFPDGTTPSSFDVTFYHLDVDIAITSPHIRGSVLCEFKAVEDNLQSITLDLHQALAVDSITGNVDCYHQADDTIHIALDRTYQLGESAEITVHYGGIPELAGGYKGLRYETHSGGEPVIASLSTPFLAHYWWPCKDGPGDKADSVWLDITIPDTTIAGYPLVAVSNGNFYCITHGKKNTYHWKHRYPIVPYYVMVAISNYRVFQETYTGFMDESFPLIYHVFDEHFEEARIGVQQLPEAMRLFSRYFGIYPFANERYGMTQLGFYGGIENQTNTVIGQMSADWFLVSVHELAHMWFGDMITCQSWQHGWLNEGFATYCEALWQEHTGGFQAYKNQMSALAFFQGGTLYLQDDSDPFNIFISIIYDKGAWALHMLRGGLGDSLFFECLSEYAGDPRFRYGHATTEDFLGICEAVSGMDLDFFFDQWVYDEFFPRYEYSFGQADTSDEVMVILRQTQSDLGLRAVFEMPVQLRFLFQNATDTTVTVWNDQQEQTFHFSFDKKVLHMFFDPDQWILRTAQEVAVEEDVAANLPRELRLAQNYPNPFNSVTIIPYHLPQNDRVSLKIYNILGQEVRTLVEGLQTAGRKTAEWDGLDHHGRPASSGIYVYRLQAGDHTMSRRLMLLR
jgi:aminopeptidase N